MPIYSNLAKGINLWGFSAGVNMEPGQALDAQDVLYRGDGAFYKHWGWRRINPTAVGARIIAHKGFNYKGKNTVGARLGNFGIADDGADFTRRQAFYSTAIVMTDTELRFWNPATETLDLPVLYHAGAWQPAGLVIDPDPKPTILILNNNAYIFGWANYNLRYDPVDRVLYRQGWDTVPAIGAPALQAGGTLIANATYIYRGAWIDLLTGEEGELGAAQEITTTAANRTALFAAGDFGPYGALRHYGVGAAGDHDVGLVIYRTEADNETFHFLTLVRPDATPAPPVGGAAGLANCTMTDNGLATDASLKGDVRDYQDMPLMNFATEFRSMIFGVSWRLGTDAVNVANPARIYFNDFRSERSFLERFDVRDYRDVPLQEGEVLTALAKTQDFIIVFTNTSAYVQQVTPRPQTGSIDMPPATSLKWTIGCVGPKAWTFTDGYLYWLSDRGPYRWVPGSSKPEWIGRNLVPLFIDPETGLCQLNGASKLESEVLYDQDADVVRFIFPCGTSLTPNRHISYFVRGAEMGDPNGGWVFHSPLAQALDYSGVYAGLTGAGVPVTPFDRKERLIWSDPDGFLYEYHPDLTRGGLPAGFPATGVAQAFSGVALIVTPGGLYVNGDDMEGLRLEVVHLDGTIDVRTVASNTAVNIVPDVNFSQDPTGATWYVGGIPAYWRSWVDSAGDPSSHKSLKHIYCGYNREFVGGTEAIDISVSSSSDWPAVVTRARTALLSVHRAKVAIFLSGRYFTYEFANSFPDQPFMISYIETMMKKQGRRRL